MPILRHFAERVRSLRRERRLTQELVAELAGLNYKYLGRIEGARANPSAMILMRLAQALRVHIGEFFSTTPSGRTPGGGPGIEMLAVPDPPTSPDSGSQSPRRGATRRSSR